MADREILIKRTVVVTTRTPFDEDNYPGMTEDEAVEYEKNMDRADKLGAFVESIEFSDGSDTISVEFTEDVVRVKDGAEDLKKYWTEGKGSEPLVVS